MEVAYVLLSVLALSLACLHFVECILCGINESRLFAVAAATAQLTPNHMAAIRSPVALFPLLSQSLFLSLPVAKAR